MVLKRLLIIPLLAFGSFTAFSQNTVLEYLHTRTNKDIEQFKGLLNIYRAGEELFCEIPDSILESDLMLTNTVLKAPAQDSRNFDKRYGYAGDFFGPFLLQLQKKGEEILFIDPLTDRTVLDKSKPLYKILMQRGNERLYFSTPILYQTDSSSLIDLGSVIKGSDLFGFKIFSFEIGVSMQESGKFLFQEVVTNPQSIIVNIQNNYTSLAKTRQSTTWKYAISLSKFNDDKISMNPIDSRVGYFGISYIDYNSNLLSPIKQTVAKKWRLQLTPADSLKYQQGILVEPIKPILFYIDRNTPQKWVPYFIDAVNAWQIAFEQAGFKNAIRAEIAPSAEQSPSFTEADSKINYISWKTSAQKNAFGPSPVNPRTGEISVCHVGIYSGVLDILQKWYFVQCGMTDKDAIKINLPDKVLGALLKMVISHEIGHTLGLEHNFYSSSNYNIEQLKDNKFLSEYGISPSIMDYVRCDYALGPNDNVDLENRIAKIGVYDRMAIEWGYRIFPGKTEKERAENRSKWLESMQTDPAKRFINGSDTRVLEEDLGNDNVAINEIGISNLKQLVNSPIWDTNSTESYNIFKERYEAIINHYKNLVFHIITHVGGKKLDFETKQYVREEKQYQDKVIAFVCNNLLMDNFFFDNPTFKKFSFNKEKVTRDFISALVPSLVGRFKNLAVEENNSNDYNLDKYISDFHSAIFYDWNNTPDKDNTSYCNILKEVYVKELKNLLKQNISSYTNISILTELQNIKNDAERLISKSNSAANINSAKLLLWQLDGIMYHN